MISFLASPKRFSGEIAVIQRRAIESWLKIHPNAEVILYGTDAISPEGLDAARITTVPLIVSSPSGAPHFDAIAEHASRNAKYDLQVYLNCDILLAPGVSELLGQFELAKFLVVGQRINLAKGVTFDPSESDWMARIRQLADANKAELYAVSGVDYFAFPRGMWAGLAPVTIGRGGYDGALVAYCLWNAIPVIDATFELFAVHQYHGYGHIVGGAAAAHQGKEAQLNYALHGTKRSTPTIADADMVLLDGKILREKCRGDKLREIELLLRYRYKLKAISLFVRALWRVLQVVGSPRQKELSLEMILSHRENRQSPKGRCATSALKSQSN